MDELIDDTAPRLFAVVQSYEPPEGYADEADARVAAWGMAFDGYAEIVSVEGGARMSVCSLDRAVRRFGRGTDVSARLCGYARERIAPSDPNSFAFPRRSRAKGAEAIGVAYSAC